MCKKCGKVLESNQTDYCSDKCIKDKEDDEFYFLQDWLNIAREMGISKREFLEDYYFDEFIILINRNAKMINERSKEKPDEEYADDFFK